MMNTPNAAATRVRAFFQVQCRHQLPLRRGPLPPGSSGPPQSPLPLPSRRRDGRAPWSSQSPLTPLRRNRSRRSSLMSRTPVPSRDVVRLRALRSPQGLALPSRAPGRPARPGQVRRSAAANSCPRGPRRGCRRPRPARRAAAIHHPAGTPATTGSGARRAARHLPNARNCGRSRPETPGGAGRNRPGLAGMVRENLGYSRVLAGLNEPVRAGIASPPRSTVPGGARRRARSPPCLVALPRAQGILP